ncbi:DegT/DnrJ/EryC1/StrS family aminotransferase [Salinimicrobium xinjiangense]|uniref:DegT/DnrJ/EryC1/StrS family aminotransferase n=1 Tax=Salinimicrobium xinjiangense TaxID=438596 RepID=UPI000413B5BB|nr:DegT/DnrJ/EryC1/StrS family aminotransferase [Salinimicrobium xinjiangense]
MIPVTKTFFPPIEDYQAQLKRIWENEWLTNRGELVKELELKLKKHLEVTNITLMTNGTLPLQIALKVLGGKGEIITTPFSYVATTSAIVWENCKPIFVDIHPEYLTIDETKIEAAITPRTTAILATHVFGNPCNVEEIENIARRHDLKVIYDAAHCFGVKYKGKSIFEYGDISTCSFHATKLFHTGEGGAIFCKNEELNHKLNYSHNFGHNGPEKFYGVGINAKMSELQAAMGLTVLSYIKRITQDRKAVCSYYDAHLDSSKVQKLKLRKNSKWNYSYYPVIFESEKSLLEIQEVLNKNGIFPRRYFYPSLNTLEYLNNSRMPLSENIAGKIMCLPIYQGLDVEDMKTITEIINSYGE